MADDPEDLDSPFGLPTIGETAGMTTSGMLGAPVQGARIGGGVIGMHLARALIDDTDPREQVRDKIGKFIWEQATGQQWFSRTELARLRTDDPMLASRANRLQEGFMSSIYGDFQDTAKAGWVAVAELIPRAIERTAEAWESGEWEKYGEDALKVGGMVATGFAETGAGMAKNPARRMAEAPVATALDSAMVAKAISGTAAAAGAAPGARRAAYREGSRAMGQRMREGLRNVPQELASGIRESAGLAKTGPMAARGTVERAINAGLGKAARQAELALDFAPQSTEAIKHAARMARRKFAAGIYKAEAGSAAKYLDELRDVAKANGVAVPEKLVPGTPEAIKWTMDVESARAKGELLSGMLSKHRVRGEEFFAGKARPERHFFSGMKGVHKMPTTTDELGRVWVQPQGDVARRFGLDRARAVAKRDGLRLPLAPKKAKVLEGTGVTKVDRPGKAVEGGRLWYLRDDLSVIDSVTPADLGALGKAVSLFKRAKVVLSPSSHINALLGDASLQALDGGNPLDVVTMGKAARRFAKKVPTDALDDVVWQKFVEEGGGVALSLTEDMYQHAGLKLVVDAAGDVESFSLKAASRKALANRKVALAKAASRLPNETRGEHMVRFADYLMDDVLGVGGSFNEVWALRESANRAAIYRRNLVRSLKDAGAKFDPKKISGKKFQELLAKYDGDGALSRAAMDRAFDLGMDYAELPLYAQMVKRTGIEPFISYPVKASGVWGREMAANPEFFVPMFVRSRELEKGTRDKRDWMRIETAKPHERYNQVFLGPYAINTRYMNPIEFSGGVPMTKLTEGPEGEALNPMGPYGAAWQSIQDGVNVYSGEQVYDKELDDPAMQNVKRLGFVMLKTVVPNWISKSVEHGGKVGTRSKYDGEYDTIDALAAVLGVKVHKDDWRSGKTRARFKARLNRMERQLKADYKAGRVDLDSYARRRMEIKAFAYDLYMGLHER